MTAGIMIGSVIKMKVLNFNLKITLVLFVRLNVIFSKSLNYRFDMFLIHIVIYYF